jgi:hypothetical protein
MSLYREMTPTERKIQQEVFAAHAAFAREGRERARNDTPEKEFDRMVARGRALHVRGLSHNCWCHLPE